MPLQDVTHLRNVYNEDGSFAYRHLLLGDQQLADGRVMADVPDFRNGLYREVRFCGASRPIAVSMEIIQESYNDLRDSIQLALNNTRLSFNTPPAQYEWRFFDNKTKVQKLLDKFKEVA